MVLALTFIVNFVVYPVLELYVCEVSPYHVSLYRAASIEFLLDEDFEIDEYIESNLPNPAHAIIYSSLYSKSSEIISNRERFIEESNNIGVIRQMRT